MATQQEQEKLVTKIINAKKLEDIIDITNFKQGYRDVLKLIHTDVCKVPKTEDATKKINLWVDEYNNGKTYTDDLGKHEKIKTNGYWVEFSSESPLLKYSIENYEILCKRGDATNPNFRKYIPQRVEKLPDNTYRFHFERRAIPLAALPTPFEQKHVNWILNRLLEYSAYIRQEGMSHCGFNMESIFIVPETHGIQVCSFYHMTAIGKKIGTISGKYGKWYPPEIFTNKIATSDIDVELSKRIAATLLGDSSGVGVKLKRTHDKEFIDFITSSSRKEPFDVMDTYKKMIAKNYKKEFHILDL